MKVTCNSLLEAPVINMIRLYDSLNVRGVCGILTKGSKHTLEHTTLGALALLSYCNELIVTDCLTDKLEVLDVTISKGPITYLAIANSGGPVLSVPKELSSEPFGFATDEITFKLVVGMTTAQDTLTDEDVFAFITNGNYSSYEFTEVPLPLLSKNILKFDVTADEGKSTIECSEVSETVLKDLFSYLITE